MNKYFSFLICDHGNVVNFYLNGLPVGCIIDGKPTPNSHKMPDWSLQNMSMRDLVQPNQFKTGEELRAYLKDLIDKLVID